MKDKTKTLSNYNYLFLTVLIVYIYFPSIGYSQSEQHVVVDTFIINDDRFVIFKSEPPTETRIAFKLENGQTILIKNPNDPYGKVEFRNGRPVLWVHGAQHTFLGKVSIQNGFIFNSSEEDPLIFRVDKYKGYVYVKGKGTVTTPDGDSINLPLSQNRQELHLKEKQN